MSPKDLAKLHAATELVRRQARAIEQDEVCSPADRGLAQCVQTLAIILGTLTAPPPSITDLMTAFFTGDRLGAKAVGPPPPETPAPANEAPTPLRVRAHALFDAAEGMREARQGELTQRAQTYDDASDAVGGFPPILDALTEFERLKARHATVLANVRRMLDAAKVNRDTFHRNDDAIGFHEGEGRISALEELIPMLEPEGS